MMTLLLNSLIMVLLSSSAPQANGSIEGTFRGTSICIQRHTACNDEHVVYYIARIGPDSAGVTPFRVTANKIINGIEEDMGVVSPCRFTHKTSSLYCPMPPTVRPGDWRFILTNDRIDGGLWVPGGARLRNVHVVRDHPSAKPK